MKAARKNDTILSFSGDRNLLFQRESALRKVGFEVISVDSETQARFEIEMGRCGILLMCFRARAESLQGLSNLFKRYCPEGRVVFVMNQRYQNAPSNADFIVPDSGPEAIVEALRSEKALAPRRAS